MSHAGDAPQEPSSAGPKARVAGYNPALDGLRALAVLAVLGFHLDVLSGGFLGVDVFFVLSGFLITGLLLAERDRAGTVSLARFYVRRAYRLLPAFGVFVAIGAVLVVAVKTQADQRDFLANTVTSLLYVNNYYRVFRPESGGAWFGHTWSLSLEEQFYLIWPVMLVLLCRRPAARRRLPGILAAAAVGVLVWREVLVAAGVSDARIYFGLDTRADALLVGASMAAWGWAGTKLPGAGGDARLRRFAAVVRLARLGGRLRDASGRILAVAGPLALAALVVLAVVAPEPGERITVFDLGGYTGVALLAAVVILSLDRCRRAPLAALLGSRPLSWFGRISYAFYLWHFPVAGTVRDRLGGRLDTAELVLVAFVLSTALAAGSYYLVERPVQRRRPRWAAGPAVPAQRAAVGSGALGEPVA
ncbi:putative membrane-bound acyl-transferase [Frankia canadensis]|uniref:Putative membrane-bound acyl-transferase n=1 Tax=Frankia canadensis TaxID=1836972 RepID=A0A2I2KXI2_9ACTN|nr:acyltransferase [Frankia canadensis]SNQ50371.1 putative membrane-bound acyl-transferase [Frankia canadensis]SOU57661.1 putative membrane-bound acyl-transferase [Frankia canadensis]